MVASLCLQLISLSSMLAMVIPFAMAQENMDYRKRFKPLGSVEPPRYDASRDNNTVSTSAVGAPVPLSASVFVFSFNDVPVTSKGECMIELERAALFASRRVQFVVTTYFYDANKDTFVESYCVMEYVGGMRQCKPWDAVTRSKFYDGIQTCVRYALALGFTDTITFNPRLDMLPDSTWRVSAQFDPLQALGGVSYFDVMLKPFATLAKLVASISPSTVVRLGLGGEMHFTLTYEPTNYIQIIKLLRAEAGSASFQVGAHFSPWELCPATCSLLTAAKRAAITELFSSLDFIGVSVYPQIPEEFSLGSLEWELLEMQAIIKSQVGVDIASFASRGALHILELGWGGGISDNGDVPAVTAAQVAANPWRGIFGAYNAAKDPWMQHIPDDVYVVTRAWLRKAYSSVLAWLNSGGGPNLRVGDAYVWSLASWDVLGIHWLSYDAMGSTYRDNVVANKIAQHNSAISGARITYSFPYRRGTGAGCWDVLSWSPLCLLTAVAFSIFLHSELKIGTCNTMSMF